MHFMDGKVALITGAGRGIGRAVALGLAEDGYNLGLISLGSKHLGQTAKETLRQYPQAKVLDIAADVADIAAVESAVSQIIDKFGKVDLLFNNAGLYVPGTLDISPDELNRMWDVNLKGAWNILKVVVPYMKRAGEGYIFNVSSRAGTVGFPNSGAYCATKFGLVGLNESLYRELCPNGIRVTALCPSWVDTEMAIGCPLPKEERIQPQDIVQAIRFLVKLPKAVCVKELVFECRGDLS